MKWCVYQENCDHSGNKVVSFYSNALQRVKRVIHKAKAGRMSKVWKHQAISEWSICMHCKYPGVENSNTALIRESSPQTTHACRVVAFPFHPP